MAMISEEDKKELLALKPEDLTFSKLVSLLGNIEHDDKNGDPNFTKSRFSCQDTFKLTPLDNPHIKESIITTVGKFIYNKYVVEGSGTDNVLGYVNWEISNDGCGKVEDILSSALLDDKINRDQFDAYLDRRDNIGQQLHAVICSSFTRKIIETPKSVQKEKDRLFELNKEKIAAGDPKTAIDIEKKLLAMAKEELKDDPAMDLYTSGARGSFDNNYKNNNIMKGAVINKITGKYDIIKSSFMDGIEKKDIPTYGNTVIEGSYPGAVGTQIGGYMSKKLSAALQTEVLDVKGSDCGSKRYITVTITPKNKSDFIYRYIKNGDKLVLLDADNIEKFMNKPVQMRSPMMCCGEKLCNVCMGDFFYKLGINNVGLTTTRVSSRLVKLRLKAKHDTTKKMPSFDPDDLLI